MRASVLAVTAACVLGSARAALVEQWWNISYASVNPDQMFQRRVIGVNGTWPPPIVEVNQGDQLIIHAYNGLGDVGTALHSHGIYFNGSGYYDGAVSVTQCPIPPGQTLSYEIPTDLQSGTYWIHGHYLGQYIDGLRTPFIIHPAQNVQKYDEDLMLVMGDWYHEEHAPLIAYYINPLNPTGAEPIPTSAVIYAAQNGQYIHSNSDISKGVGVSSPNSTAAALSFEPGKTYRIRLINMAAFAMFHFAIDGHNMSIIEVDGADVEPLEVTNIPISAAQRYSVLVTARNDTTQNWPISMNMEGSMYDTIPDDLVLNYTAQISYSPSNSLPNATIFQDYPVWWDTKLVPVEVQANAPADTSFTLNIWFDTYDDGTNRGTFNNITYSPPLVPSLYTELTMSNNSYLPRIYGAQTNALVYNHMDNIELVIYNWHTDSHPFHLHGHKFQVVQQVLNVLSSDPSINPPLVEDQANPARRDTIMVPSGGMVRLRYRADNPGTWIFHCHIEWHLESGLAVVMVEAPTEAQQSLKVPQAMLDQCASQSILTTGNVVGKNSTTDFTGEPWGPFPEWHLIGWTPRAKGALAGTILAALAGICVVVWYAMDPFKDEERDELAREEFEAKRKKGGKFGAVKKLVNRKKT